MAPVIAPDPPSLKPRALWFDLTDLATWTGALTGIQRVMAGLAREFLAAAPALAAAGLDLRFCYYKRDEGYFPLAAAETQRLLAALGGDRALIAGKGKLIGPLKRRVFGIRHPFARGDAYFCAGIVTNRARLRLLATTVEALAMPVLVVIHDVIPLKFREWCKLRTFETFHDWFRFVAARSVLVLTPSRHTLTDVKECAVAAGLPCPTLAAVPLPHKILAEDGLSTGAGSAATALPQRFVLYVSTIEPRKNHRLLFYLWKRLLSNHGADAVPDLVFLGKRGWQSADFVSEMSNAAFLDGKLRWIAAADDALLAEAYRRSCFTLFPSFYEGFGLPVAESLYFGKYCIASNEASVPEVGGDLIDYFDPYELGEVQRLVCQALFDDGFLEAREARIRARFRPWSWPDYASAMLAEITRALR